MVITEKGQATMHKLANLIRHNYTNWLFVTFGEEVPADLPEFQTIVARDGTLLVLTDEREETTRHARLMKALEVWGANFEIRKMRLLNAA